MTTTDVQQVLTKLQSIDTVHTIQSDMTEPHLISIKPITINNKVPSPHRITYTRTPSNTPLTGNNDLHTVTKQALTDLQFRTANTFKSPKLIYSPMQGHLQAINNTYVQPEYDNPYLNKYMMSSPPVLLHSVSEFISPNSQSRQWSAIA